MIYFDNAATTWTLKEAEQVFLEANETHFGNPSSSHAFGRDAAGMLEEARASILKTLGLENTHSLLFTSGATESNNLALKGIALHYQNRGKKVITSAVEHPSVLKAVEELQQLGFETVVLPVNGNGQVEAEALSKALDKNTILVSIMAVNNETGAINDIAALGKAVHAYPKAFFHVDATQAMGKLAMAYGAADLLSFSAHKFGGFKGTGGLLYKKSISFWSVNAGGEQERGFRAGTVNMPGFAAMAKALAVDYASLAANERSVGELRSYLWAELDKTGAVSFNSPKDGLPYVLNFSLKKKKASVVLEALSERGIYVSSVSACSSKGEPISSVLLAMGKSEGDARNSIRLSFSPRNTLEEGKEFMEAFQAVLKEVIDR